MIHDLKFECFFLFINYMNGVFPVIIYATHSCLDDIVSLKIVTEQHNDK